MYIYFILHLCIYKSNPHKGMCFIRTARLKFNLLNLLNENSQEAETGRERLLYKRCHVFRIPKNFQEFLTFSSEFFCGKDYQIIDRVSECIQIGQEDQGSFVRVSSVSLLARLSFSGDD